MKSLAPNVTLFISASSCSLGLEQQESIAALVAAACSKLLMDQATLHTGRPKSRVPNFRLDQNLKKAPPPEKAAGQIDSSRLAAEFHLQDRADKPADRPSDGGLDDPSHHDHNAGANYSQHRELFS